MDTKYVRYEKNITKSGYKLLCFHYAGGGASYFAGWQNYMKYGIEVLPIQLPGRENRLKEKFLLSCKEAAENVVHELSGYLKSGNFSVFGHSMGGIIAFETVKYFEREGIFPDVCFISSTSLVDKQEVLPSCELNDNDFFEKVALYGAVDKNSEILQYPEFKEIYLKILRADFGMIERYKDDLTMINCPVVAMCGKSDPMESIEKMRSWSRYTSGRFKVKEYIGGHFYIQDNLHTVCSDISDIINIRRTEAAYEQLCAI